MVSSATKPCRDVGTFGQDARRAIESCSESIAVTLDCGHETSIRCSKLPFFLSSSWASLQCTRVVSVELPCGHKVDVECHKRQQAALSKCTSTKLVKCWNFGVCQNQIEVPCGFSGVPACSGESDWTCTSGLHFQKLLQCSVGVPEECYWCTLDKLSAKIVTAHEPFHGEEDLRNLVNLPPACVKWISAPIDVFLSVERQQLEKCLSHARTVSDVNDQFVLKASRVPCFRSLAKKNADMERFEPKKFCNGAKSFHGIVSRHLSGSNLRLLLQKDKCFTLLIGYASVVHTKSLNDSPPKQNKDRTNLARSLAIEGYDSMTFIDDQQFHSLLVLDPYPMIALARVTLNQAQLEILASQLDRLKTPDLEPRKVKIHPPATGCTIFQTKSTSRITSRRRKARDFDEDDDSDSSIESDDSSVGKEAQTLLRGTAFEGMSLNLKWQGGIELGENIPKSVEQNLVKKMEFINPGAPPFAGLQLIRSLVVKDGMEPLQLLMAAESVSHSRSEARSSLDAYLQIVRSESPRMRLHPWSLIVAARVEDNDAVRTSLLSTFMRFFPMEEKYLSEKELEMLRGLTAIETSTPDVHTLLLKEWADLRAAYPGEVNSAATEEVLKLTGLRKVKQEAIRIWKRERGFVTPI